MAGRRRIVGLVPAAGRATRLSPLPCSKELLPIGMGRIGPERVLRPKAVSHYLLERFASAGVSEVFIVLRNGKWDIPAYYGDGTLAGVRMAYLVTNGTEGHPFTLDQARPFVSNDLVAFGYPDILFGPDDAFALLASCQAETGADCVLGAFPLKPEQAWDVLRFDDSGRIRTVSAEDAASDAHDRWGWGIALWTPAFTQFMHRFLAGFSAGDAGAESGQELALDHVFQAAIDDGLPIEHVKFADGFVLDVGTPENLKAAQHGALAD